jgi:hypothetical protein
MCRGTYEVPPAVVGIVQHDVSLEPIKEHWDDFLRLLATIDEGWGSATDVLERFGSDARGHKIYLPVRLSVNYCARFISATTLRCRTSAGRFIRCWIEANPCMLCNGKSARNRSPFDAVVELKS